MTLLTTPGVNLTPEQVCFVFPDLAQCQPWTPNPTADYGPILPCTGQLVLSPNLCEQEPPYFPPSEPPHSVAIESTGLLVALGLVVMMHRVTEGRRHEHR